MDQWIDIEEKANTLFCNKHPISLNEVSKHLNLKQLHTPIHQGSTASIYPYNDKIVKITNDISDIENLYYAQKLNSPNIVKMFSHHIGTICACALLEYVHGNLVKVPNEAILSLVHGSEMDNYAKASEGVLNKKDRSRNLIIDRFKINRKKWSRLFQTLHQLDEMGMLVVDLSENIIDNGSELVLIDLGLTC